MVSCAGRSGCRLILKFPGLQKKLEKVFICKKKKVWGGKRLDPTDFETFGKSQKTMVKKKSLPKEARVSSRSGRWSRGGRTRWREGKRPPERDAN